jgi:predicted SnoaL-like aldol condensation-catalyzing enzyme
MTTTTDRSISSDRADIADIADIFARYYIAVDTHDVEGWLALWSEDGELDSGHVRARGLAELRAFIADHVVHTRHLVTNVTVDVEADTGRAIAQHYMMVLPTNGKPDPIATAHCRSDLARDARGAFRLVRHVYRPDPSFLPPGVGAAAAHEVAASARDEAALNKAIVKLLTLELWGQRDESAVDRYFAVDYVQHSAHAAQGREGVRGFFRAITRAMPDLEVTLDHLYAEGDRVFAFMTWTGTQREPLFGAPPTNAPKTFRTAEIHRLSGGRIAEHWDVVSASE